MDTAAQFTTCHRFSVRESCRACSVPGCGSWRLHAYTGQGDVGNSHWSIRQRVVAESTPGHSSPPDVVDATFAIAFGNLIRWQLADAVSLSRHRAHVPSPTTPTQGIDLAEEVQKI